MLSEVLGVPHISSGDLLRALREETPSGMQRGELVADDLVTRLVVEQLDQPGAQRGAILDGFPRTLHQARALDSWLDQRGGCIRAALYLEVAPETLQKRMVGRRERADDTAEVAARRVDVFQREQPSVLEHYAKLERLYTVDGTKSIERVHQRITQILQHAG
jgi:adenylate kinase